jgi:hypothetical protein
VCGRVKTSPCLGKQVEQLPPGDRFSAPGGGRGAVPGAVLGGTGGGGFRVEARAARVRVRAAGVGRGVDELLGEELDALVEALGAGGLCRIGTPGGVFCARGGAVGALGGLVRTGGGRAGTRRRLAGTPPGRRRPRGGLGFLR